MNRHTPLWTSWLCSFTSFSLQYVTLGRGKKACCVAQPGKTCPLNEFLHCFYKFLFSDWSGNESLRGQEKQSSTVSQEKQIARYHLSKFPWSPLISNHLTSCCHSSCCHQLQDQCHPEICVILYQSIFIPTFWASDRFWN